MGGTDARRTPCSRGNERTDRSLRGVRSQSAGGDHHGRGRGWHPGRTAGRDLGDRSALYTPDPEGRPGEAHRCDRGGRSLVRGGASCGNVGTWPPPDPARADQSRRRRRNVGPSAAAEPRTTIAATIPIISGAFEPPFEACDVAGGRVVVGDAEGVIEPVGDGEVGDGPFEIFASRRYLFRKASVWG